MSATLILLNHSSYKEYWTPCIDRIIQKNELSYSQINLEEIWETNSSFQWDTQLKLVTEKNQTETLILLAYGCGTVLLKSWLKANQPFINKFKAHAIFIDSPSLSEWQNNNPLEKFLKMDRATYTNEVLKTLTKQSAADDWVRSIPSKTNYLKSLLLEIHSKTQLLDDQKPLIPLTEEWYEINSTSLPITSAKLLKQERISLANWQSFELIAPIMPVFPTSYLTPYIQRIIANILCVV